MYIGLHVSTSYSCHILIKLKFSRRRSQWSRGLRRRSPAARLLRSWVRIPPGALIFVRCECCVPSGRCLCDELITRPKESYRLWCVVVCDLETSRMRRPWPALGRSVTEKKISRQIFGKYSNIKFHENPSSGNQVSPCGRTDRDAPNANASKNDEGQSIFFFAVALRPNAGNGLLILEVF